MRKTVLVIFSCFLSLLFVPKTYGQGQDKLLGLLKEELAQQMKELKGEEFPPYHMNYRVIDVTSSVVSASFGALMNSQQYRSRMLVPQIRLGDEKLDNFRFNQMGSAMSRFQGPSMARLPLDEENNEDAVRQAIWDEVNNRYKFAVNLDGHGALVITHRQFLQTAVHHAHQGICRHKLGIYHRRAETLA